MDEHISLPARVRARLSAEGYFGLQLLAGAVAIIVAASAFGYLARNIAEGAPLTALDAELAAWFHAHAQSSPLTDAMLAVSLVNGVGGILVLSAFFALFLIGRRDWPWLAYLVIAVPGGMLINTLAKLAFARQRPVFDDPIVVLSTYSFPSGHTVSSTLFYGTLAVFLTPRVGRRWRPWLWVAAAAIVAVVGASRIYIGAHYLSDVLAALAEGVVWLSCCLVGLSTYRWRTRRRAAMTSGSMLDSSSHQASTHGSGPR